MTEIAAISNFGRNHFFSALSFLYLSGTSKKVTLSEIDKIKENEKRQRELLMQEKEKERKKLADNPEMESENPNIKMAEMLEREGIVTYFFMFDGFCLS